jgi:hypothetical protein
MITGNKRFNQWIFESFQVTANGLGMFRIFTAMFIFYFLIPGQGTSHFIFLSEMPADFFAPPPGPLMLLEAFPGYTVFQVLHTMLICSLLCMLFGYYTKLSSIMAGITVLILQGLVFSIGKVNHEILIAVVPVVMAFSNWGASFSVDSIRKGFSHDVHSWPLTLLALLVGFMMFTAGFPKILGGWLDLSTQATQGHLFNQFFVRERDALLAVWFLNFDSIVFWELLDWATVVFEVGFLVTVLSGKWFKRFVCLAVMFHFSTMLMLNIAFLPNFLAYAAFLNWTGIYKCNLRVFRRISGKKGENSKKESVWLLSGVLLVVFTSLSYLSLKEVYLIDTDLMLHEVVIVSVSLAVVVFLAVLALFPDRSRTDTEL